METIKDRINLFRKYMLAKKLDAFIIPSGDPHFGEYVQDHYKSREWLSGFTGSAGTLVITIEHSALWTDSRYFVQAAEELCGTGITLMKMKVEGTPSVEEWLKGVVKDNAKVGIDASLVSVLEHGAMEKSFSPLQLVLEEDPFTRLRANRPALERGLVWVMPDDISGESCGMKLERVAAMLGVEGDFNYLLSTCDDVAWMCNMRGSDVLYNPLFYSYLVIHRDSMDLFVSSTSLDDESRMHLKKNKIRIHDYDSFGSFLGKMNKDFLVIAPLNKTSMATYSQIDISNVAGMQGDNIPGGVVGFLKSVKNKCEIDGFGKAMVYDGVAWVKFWMSMEKMLADGQLRVTENDLAQLLISKRGENSDYKGESFHPIVAFASNGAQPHYCANETNPTYIGSGNFLLVDTGAHYPFGTTDTTRTFAIGDLDQESKLDYTAVLKGMINLSKAVFPRGTRGASMDILARGEVFKRGKRYLHGTGHGVGHFLCVHEGPQSIRAEENPVVFQPGMVTSNEPAIYQEGNYGIRIENMLVCKEWKETCHGEFLCFETLTLVPIDKNPVISSELGQENIEWLNNYHSVVYKTLSPFLDESERVWLSEKTSNI